MTGSIVLSRDSNQVRASDLNIGEGLTTPNGVAFIRFQNGFLRVHPNAGSAEFWEISECTGQRIPEGSKITFTI